MPGKVKQPAGSPTAGEPALLSVGRFRRPHGVAGEILIELYTDFPERLQPKKVVFAGGRDAPLIIQRARSHKDGLLLTFEGLTTPEEVGRYRNQLLYVKSIDRSPLPSGQYYHDELIGSAVITDEERPLGVLTEIIQTGANDVYLVRDFAGGEILLPAITEVILKIDLSQKTMRVHLLPGLVDPEEP